MNSVVTGVLLGIAVFLLVYLGIRLAYHVKGKNLGITLKDTDKPASEEVKKDGGNTNM